MSNFATLPDLVILNILKYLELPTEEIGKKLDYCAISHRWRQLAVPLVYNRVRFVWSYPVLNYDQDVDVIDTRWGSNIDLFTTKALQKLVKKVDIDINDNELDFALLLGPLLDRINQSTIGWPQEYGSQLTGEIVRGYGLDMTYLHQSLNDDLIRKMRCGLEKFASKFPSVSCLRVNLCNARGTARQFTSQLLDVFYSQTQDLDLHFEFPFDLEYYPPELKRLEFTFTPSTKYPLPKIRNPGILESWSMNHIFYDVAWSDLVDVPADGSSVVFSNLTTLSLGYYDRDWFSWIYDMTTYYIPDRLSPAQDLQVQFPRLTNLTLVSDIEQEELQFTPQVIPFSLGEVCLHIVWKDLVAFCKLPIRSIGKLRCYIHLCMIEDMNEFYQISNRLLDKIDNFGNFTRFHLKGKFDQVDMKRIRWTNVTELELTFIDATTLMELFTKLPLLRSIIIARLIYSSNYNTIQQDNPQLSDLEIGKLKGEEWTVDNAAKFIFYLMNKHPDISKLVLPRDDTDLKERVKEMFRDTQWKYVKLENSDLGYIYSYCACQEYGRYDL